MRSGGYLEEIRQVTPRAQLAITVKHTGSTATITLVGELDVAIVNDVHHVMKKVVADGRLDAIHIDATRVTFVDSAGLRSLTRACQTAEDYFLRFTIAASANGPVVRMVAMSGLEAWFASAQPDGCSRPRSRS